MRRRNFIILRVALVAGILVVGFTLHHRGTAYIAIRAVYLVIVVALLIWRIGNRRRRRSGRNG
jgi:ABC-type transport system involved in Fe-S cluster assembly fused permease/ATPase subunit